MNPRNLQNFLSTLVDKGLHQSVMIWGPPGIGKSQTVAEVARAAGIDLIDLRLSQLAPTDLRGLPVADHKDRTSRWYPPEFLPRGGKGILFLDELNMAPPAMQGIAQQLVLDRQVGSYQLPEGWHVWAAGNRIEDGASVFQMPSALQNRFVHLSVEANFDSFRQWALGHGIHERIVAFLAFRPQLLHKRDAAQPAWPSPRAWAAANALYQADLTIEPAVGKGAAGEFSAYERVYASLPDLDAILAGKGKSVAFPSSPDARYATVIGLATRAKDQKSVKSGLDWVVEKADAEWIQLFVYAKLDTASADNTLGILAATLAANPKVKKFLESYRKLVGQK
jgi:MoxR-like ATPase